MRATATIACMGLASLLLAACEPPGSPGPGTPPAPPAEAAGTANSRDFGDYVVHFNAMRTSDLTPGVAENYGIVRSPNRAMVTISLLRKVQGTAQGTEPGTPDVPVTGAVSAEAVNLNGQMKNLTLQEIREGEAVYYIGHVAIAPEETLVVTVNATPEGSNRPLQVRFTQHFP